MTSLQWDSFDQFCLWQLLSAEGPDCSLIIPALASLTPQDHPEAISSALLFLKTESSNSNGISAILSLPDWHSEMVSTVASRWIQNRPTKYSRYITQFLESHTKPHVGEKTDHLASLTPVFDNLEKLLKHLNGKQVFEASELLLAKSVSKVFGTYPQLVSKCKDLHKLVTGLTAETSKNDSSVSRKSVGEKSSSKGDRSPSVGEKRAEKSVSHGDRDRKTEAPRPKKRRVLNREELTDL